MLPIIRILPLALLGFLLLGSVVSAGERLRLSTTTSTEPPPSPHFKEEPSWRPPLPMQDV